MRESRQKFDALLLFGVCLVALFPMSLVIWSQLPKPAPTPLAPPTPISPPAAEPTSTEVPITSSSPAPTLSLAFKPEPPRLSPDGLYAATTQEASGISTADVSSNRVLLILRVSDGSVVSRRRVTVSGENLAWSRNGQSLAVWGQDNGQIWSREVSTQPKTTFGGRFFEEERSGNNLEVDQENDVAFQVDANSGLSAHRISTGKSIPIHNTWRPNEPFAEIAMAPSILQDGGKKLLYVTSEVWEEVFPTPAPTLTPTPMVRPTPTPLTPEQKKFLQEEGRLSEEVSNIVGKLQGEEELSDQEIKQLETRAKAINQQIRQGRARFFPTPPPPPPPPASNYQQPGDEYGRVVMRDLRTGGVVWIRKTLSTYGAPHLLFSPDGSSLLLLGQPFQKNPSRRDNRSLEVLDPLTGRTRFMLETSSQGIVKDMGNQFFQSGHPMFAYRDSDNKDEVLHIKDLSDGHEISKWSLNALKPLGIGSFENFSCDASGKTWAFSTENKQGNGWKVFTRVQLEAQSKIAPPPTPAP